MANIRWRTKDIEELRNELDRYNRKVARLARKGQSSEYFEKMPSFKDVQPGITTRAEYKDLLSKLRNYTAKGSERQYAPAAQMGISLTEAEKNELDRRIKEINKDRQQMKKDYEANQQRSTKDLPQHDVNKFQFNPKRTVDEQLNKAKENGWSPQAFERFKETVNKQSDPDYLNNRFEQYKASYIKTAIEKLGSQYGGQIAARVEQIPAKDFYFLALSNYELSIDYLYDPIPIIDKVETILSILGSVGW